MKSKTVMVTFGVGHVMLFGDSRNRTWNDQLAEYCREFKKKPIKIAVSDQKWPNWLKWCSLGDFQSQLDWEGKGRKVFSDFKWREMTPRESRLAFEATGGLIDAN